MKIVSAVVMVVAVLGCSSVDRPMASESDGGDSTHLMGFAGSGMHDNAPDGGLSDVDAALADDASVAEDSAVVALHDAGAGVDASAAADAGRRDASVDLPRNGCGGTSTTLACPLSFTGQCPLATVCAHPNSTFPVPCWNGCAVIPGVSVQWECGVDSNSVVCPACSCK
jgi:hypothetical protein